jgi:hypothetical protein
MILGIGVSTLLVMWRLNAILRRPLSPEFVEQSRETTA